MFAVVDDDSGDAILRVRLSGRVTVSDLNRRAVAMGCERRLETLARGASVMVDAGRLVEIEAEAQGALLFLLQRALEVPDVEVVMVLPSGGEAALEHSYVRRVLAHECIHVFARRAEAERYVRRRAAA